MKYRLENKKPGRHMSENLAYFHVLYQVKQTLDKGSYFIPRNKYKYLEFSGFYCLTLQIFFIYIIVILLESLDNSFSEIL